MIPTGNLAMQQQSRLHEHITQEIVKHGGKLAFTDFMQQALYTPGLGYYSSSTRKIGRDGDFITAPEMGSLFAKCVARQFSEILQATSSDTILEFGAGSGQFAGDVLDALHTLNIPIKQYLILEVSADLRIRQQEKILQQYPQYQHLVQWIDRLPTTINGVIFANEVLDAMPVARFAYQNDQLSEYYVSTKDDVFVFTLGAPSTALAAAFTQMQLLNYLTQPYSSEINLFLNPWIKSLDACLHRGAILLCDYGFPRHEYYHPQRQDGTLMCHYQHRCHANPLINIGLQDITAHVDFTAIAEATLGTDLAVGGYTNLASFLLNCGITDLLMHNSFQDAQEINTLTSPAEMGELFKCISLIKGMEPGLCGFRRFDKTATL